MSEVKKIPIRDIHPFPYPSREKMDSAGILSLAESIREIGLRTPISVYPEKFTTEGGEIPGYLLIAGHRRLAACIELGWTEIDADIVDLSEDDRELWHIDENLCREDLSDAECAQWLAHRKFIYERKHPETKHGAQGGGRGGKGTRRKTETDKLSTSVSSFAEDTAAKTGLDERTIRRGVRRAKKIAPDVLDSIKGTAMDKGVELDALADLPHDQQRQVVEMVQAGEVETAREAKAKLEGDPTPAALIKAWTKATKAWANLLVAWKDASQADRDAFCRTPAVADCGTCQRL